jgi:N-acetylated-alpha-linked acidic dipeptidase
LNQDLDRLLATINIEAPWELVTAFSTFPRCVPADVNAAGNLIAEKLSVRGVPVTIYEPELYLSIPYEASVSTATGSFRAKAPSFSTSVPEGVTGQLVHVPAAQSKSINNLFASNLADGAPKNVMGKIALIEGYGIPQKIAELEQAGAAAIITVNPGTAIHWAICTPIWGTPGLSDLPTKPKIPVVSVSRPDGETLVELARQGGSATVKTRLDEGWFVQNVVVAEIPGTDASEDFVLLHGHYDSWDVGVGDNATGDATLLEVANVLWENRAKLKRSVRIAWWPGHSTGRYAGSTWYADAFALDLSANCVAHINCDSPGCRWATEFRDLAWTPETAAYAQGVIREVTGLESFGGRAPRAGDWSFNNIGLSGFFMLSSTMSERVAEELHYYAVGGCGGNIAWHSEDDTLEIADRDSMLRDIKVYLAAVWGIANAEVLPFDWRAATATFETALQSYQAAVKSDFSFDPALSALRHLTRSLDKFYSALQSGAIPAASANTVIKRLARILVPLDQSRERRFAHDPALPRPVIPLLSLANSFPRMSAEQLKFAQVELTRNQNHVVEALRSADELIAPQQMLANQHPLRAKLNVHQ